MFKNFYIAVVCLIMSFFAIIPVCAEDEPNLIVDLDIKNIVGTSIPNLVSNGIAGEIVDFGSGAGTAVKIEADGIASLEFRPQSNDGKGIIVGSCPEMPERTVELWIKCTEIGRAHV